MDTHHTKQQHQGMREKVDHEEAKLKQQGKGGQQEKQQPLITMASAPSASSSPSHEFSFTVSLHHPTAVEIPDKAKTSPSFEVDLSPADEIFFHGHLLPLHLLSHLPISPRSSTNSLDSFTLPIKELLEDQNPTKNSTNNDDNNISTNNYHKISNDHEPRERSKPKTLSLFGLSKWRKGCEVREKKDDKETQKRSKRMWFEVTQLVKRYIRMVRPQLISFRGRRRGTNMQFHRQSCSLSGILSSSNKQELRGRKGLFSAPASIGTSPTNSGHLVATGAIHTSTSDSTMEELQAAIQAAIAHCKNSIAMDDKMIKCNDNH